MQQQNNKTSDPNQTPENEEEAIELKKFVLIKSNGKPLYLESSSSENENMEPAFDTEDKKNIETSFDKKSLVPLEKTQNEDEVFRKSEEEIVEESARAPESQKDDRTESYFEFEDSEEESENFKRTDLQRFIEIEFLMNEYPPSDYTFLKKTIKGYEMISERKKVPDQFIVSPVSVEKTTMITDKLKSLSLKKDTELEKIRGELNKVTSKNKQRVIEFLRENRPATINVMREVAGCFYTKMISEDIYRDLYVSIFKELSTNWKCVEEESLEKETTCLFGTVLKYLKRKIESKHTWIDLEKYEKELISKKLSTEEKESKINEAINERKRAKSTALGTIKTLVMLYNVNMLSESVLLEILSTMIKIKTEENTYLVASFVLAAPKKLFSTRDRKIVESIRGYLEAGEKKYTGEIKYKIQNALDIMVQKDYQRSVDQNRYQFDSSQEEESEETDSKGIDSIMLDFVHRSILPILLDPENKKNMDETSQNLMVRIDKFLEKYDDTQFLTYFFIDIISSSKDFDSLSEIYIKNLSSHYRKIEEAMKLVQKNYSYLIYDFPCFRKNYAVFIYKLLGNDLITQETFENLKYPDVKMSANTFLCTWKAKKDPRLPKVLNPEEIASLREDY